MSEVAERTERLDSLFRELKEVNAKLTTLLIFQGQVEEREKSRQRLCDQHNGSLTEAWHVIRDVQSAQVLVTQKVAELVEMKNTAGVVIGKTAAAVLASVLGLVTTGAAWLLHLVTSNQIGHKP